MIKVSDSLSKKGLGNGFVSKVDRFKDNRWENFWRPGPGSYAESATSTSASDTASARG